METFACPLFNHSLEAVNTHGPVKHGIGCDSSAQIEKAADSNPPALFQPLVMTSFPVEIWLQILENLPPNNAGKAIIGKNSTWIGLLDPQMPGIPKGHDVHSYAYASNNSSDLVTLRQVNRFFADLCAPLVFNEISMLNTKCSSFPDLASIRKYAKHVKTIRLLIDPELPQYAMKSIRTMYHVWITTVFNMCQEATSLGIYFLDTRLPWGPIHRFILDALERGKFVSFGVYSAQMSHWNLARPAHTADLLRKMTRSPAVRSRLQHLDIVLEKIDTSDFNCLRSSFPSLTSLSIRRALRGSAPDGVSRLWDVSPKNQWMACINLTTLSLIDCSSVAAAQVPELVGIFKGLRHLVISTCGGNSDAKLPPRRAGWSSASNTGLKNRRTLDDFHIEHMVNWEIVALGSISTKRLIATHIERGNLSSAFNSDPEIFPGLEILCVERTHEDTEALKSLLESTGTELESTIIDLAEQRNLELICMKRQALLRNTAKALIY